jgi:hypothetical protein
MRFRPAIVPTVTVLLFAAGLTAIPFVAVPASPAIAAVKRADDSPPPKAPPPIPITEDQRVPPVAYPTAPDLPDVVPSLPKGADGLQALDGGELKPATPSGAARGVPQLERYIAEANDALGPGHVGELHFYDPEWFR